MSYISPEIKEICKRIGTTKAKLDMLPFKKDVIRSKIELKFDRLTMALINTYKSNTSKIGMGKFSDEIREKLESIKDRKIKLLKKLDNQRDSKERFLKNRLAKLVEELKVKTEINNKKIFDTVMNTSKNTKPNQVSKVIKSTSKTKKGLITAAILVPIMTAAYVIQKQAQKKRMEKLKKQT